MAKIFKTNVLFEDDSSRYAAIVDVRLPTQNETLVNSIPLQLLSKYDTWVPTYDIGAFGGAEGEYYVRVSCQVYNEISDIEFWQMPFWQLYSIINTKDLHLSNLPRYVDVVVKIDT